MCHPRVIRFVVGTAMLVALCLCGAWLPALVAQEKIAGDKADKKPAADKASEKKPDKVEKHAINKSAAKKPGAGMTPAREAAALAFVHEHHPELESLLANLKERQPKQYEAAIRDLFRHSERLAGIQEGDSSRYDLELKMWKLQSRVQLLSATVLMNRSDEQAKAKLRQALVEELQLRRDVLALERERQAKRLEKLDEQIEKFNRDLEAAADRQLNAILAGGRPKPKDVQQATTPAHSKIGAQ